VIPARLLGHKESGGRVELLLVRPVSGSGTIWQCMAKSSKPLRQGMVIQLPEDCRARVVEESGEGQHLIDFDCPVDFQTFLEEHGHIPLPPYIRRDDGPFDRDRYQTVFASSPGAVAAPTAGLHFTEKTFTELNISGIGVCGIVLHVGPGTFLPVRSENLEQHRMHSERFEVPAATAALVNRAKSEGRRVVALGTTVTRTLEHASNDKGQLVTGGGETELFIRPGYRFKMVDALITNFHLPRSTLLMLVAAFAGRDLTLRAYREAVDEDYRFFSYGDCMLIV
ncbi:MAG: tRNA preQ1(34) S-adenosylmethionine ribosyltransferase-isomerase QueA, partial [Desulfuromonas sp.]